jgi:SAM-dependent methyltransferase
MRPDGPRRTYRDRPMADNPPGKDRPHEALIEAVAGRLVPPGRALDLSGDDGTNALFLAQSGFSVTLLGLVEGETEQAMVRIEEAGARADAFTSGPTSLPFDGGEFDLVFDPRVYEGLQGEERQRFVKEVHRVLRRGGRFLLVIPNYKDPARGCYTQEDVEEAFHPLFETLRVVDTVSVDQGRSLRSFYSALMVKR